MSQKLPSSWSSTALKLPARESWITQITPLNNAHYKYKVSGSKSYKSHKVICQYWFCYWQQSHCEMALDEFHALNLVSNRLQCNNAWMPQYYTATASMLQRLHASLQWFANTTILPHNACTPECTNMLQCYFTTLLCYGNTLRCNDAMLQSFNGYTPHCTNAPPLKWGPLGAECGWG